MTSSRVLSVFLGTTMPALAVAQAPLPQGGPFFHQVLSASSPDGSTFSHDGVVLLDHASVPAAIALPDGRIRLYYVDASQMPENVNCAESVDAGRSFTVLGCTVAGRAGTKAVDPSIVRLGDGRFRLYYYASADDPGAAGIHEIHAAISTDGIRFQEEGVVFAYPGLVDPDVFWSGREWLMYVFASGQGTVMARSDDGLTFTYLGPLPLEKWGTTAPLRLADGRLRLYAFSQAAPNYVGSFLSDDGLTWTQEPGVRLAPLEGKQITDPFVVPLPDGSWKMFFKMESQAGRR